MSTDPITQLAAKHAREFLTKNRYFDSVDTIICGTKEMTEAIAAALREQREQMQRVGTPTNCLCDCPGFFCLLHNRKADAQKIEMVPTAPSIPKEEAHKLMKDYIEAAGAATAEPASRCQTHCIFDANHAGNCYLGDK